MFIPKSFLFRKMDRENAALARILPPGHGKSLMPKHTLSYDQIKLHLFQDCHFVYELLLTIDPKKLSHIHNLTSDVKVSTISSFLNKYPKYKIYGIFESPCDSPTNLHFHAIISIKHKNYDSMLKNLKIFLRNYAKEIGRYSCIRINSSTEDYQPTDSISILGSSRKVGNLSKYITYINKSILTTDSYNHYHNTYINY